VFLFFLKGTECAYFIDEERGLQVGNRLKSMSMCIYILTNRTARSFAPAVIQVDASFFILAMVDGADVSLRLKTRSFCSFQISHMTSKVTVHTAFRGISGVEVTIPPPLQCCGAVSPFGWF
jgi:hypothetical protein